MHERFADWLLGRAGDRLPEFEEIVGYHLEQAFRNLIELGPADERAIALRSRAGEHLIASARRTFGTNDMRAAASLFERANDLLLDGDPRLPDALLSHAIATMETGGFDRARAVFERAEEVARSARDDRTLALLRLGRIRLSLMDETTVSASDLRIEADRAVQYFQPLDDDLGLARAFHALGEVDWLEGHIADAEATFRRAMHHAERAGEEREVRDNLAWVAVAAYTGPIGVDAGLDRCADVIARVGGDRLIHAFTKHCEGGLLAMRGEFNQAREAIAEGRGILEDFGWITEEASASQVSAMVEILAGDLEAAEQELRRGCDVLLRIGERGYLSTSAGMLANVLASMDRLGEAEHFITLSAETGSPDDGLTQVALRTAQAEVLLRRGQVEGALQPASEAVEIADGTDMLNMRGNARRELARVFRESGRIREAVDQARLALEEYERKGNVVSAKGVRRFLDELEGGGITG